MYVQRGRHQQGERDDHGRRRQLEAGPECQPKALLVEDPLDTVDRPLVEHRVPVEERHRHRLERLTGRRNERGREEHQRRQEDQVRSESGQPGAEGTPTHDPCHRSARLRSRR